MPQECTAPHAPDGGDEKLVEVWVTRNDRISQSMDGSLALCAGIAVAIGGISGLAGLDGGDSLLGVLIAGLGLALLSHRRQTVTVDMTRRLITLEDGPFHHRVREIDFDDVVGAEVDKIDREGKNFQYFVRLKLRNGDAVAVFLGYFEGHDSESAMEQRRLRLLRALRLDRRAL